MHDNHCIMARGAGGLLWLGLQSFNLGLLIGCGLVTDIKQE
jgi:hypothetical protein